MGKRIDLQNEFETILGKRHVYFQPPESVKMEYPAIRYSLSEIKSNYANDAKYSMFNRYEVIVIDTKPNDDIVQKILSMPYSSFDRRYVSNNMYHNVIILYF